MREFWGSKRTSAAAATRAAEVVLATSRDSILRVAALGWLDIASAHDEEGSRAPLDASAYAQLATVNDQEQMVLLREFVNAPPDDRTVRQRQEEIACVATNFATCAARLLRFAHTRTIRLKCV